MQVFFEEAAKVLRGVTGAASADAAGPALTASQPVAEIFQTMWREGRKYDIFLHVITQTVSELPAGILASCNNGFFVQTKNPNDRDLVMAHIGRSERGVVNTEYKRYLARIPKGYAIAKLGYSEDVADIEPMLVHPLMVPGSEPSEEEIHERLG
jgi:DNA helicase HerA-like ATPase